jgi:hypothetical protein
MDSDNIVEDVIRWQQDERREKIENQLNYVIILKLKLSISRDACTNKERKSVKKIRVDWDEEKANSPTNKIQISSVKCRNPFPCHATTNIHATQKNTERKKR